MVLIDLGLQVITDELAQANVTYKCMLLKWTGPKIQVQF